MLDRPPPLPDIADISLPVETLDAGTIFYRLHRTEYGGKFFGKTAEWRFDCPDKTFGTLYAGRSPHVAFAETLIRGEGSLISESEVKIRSLCVFQVLRPLRLMQLFGPALTTLKASASVSSGSYAVSQKWARAAHNHRDAVDGIMYRSNYDNDEFAFALFERSGSSFDSGSSKPLMGDLKLLGSILDHYNLSWV